MNIINIKRFCILGKMGMVFFYPANKPKIGNFISKIELICPSLGKLLSHLSRWERDSHKTCETAAHGKATFLGM